MHQKEKTALADHIDAVNCAVLMEREFSRLDKWQKRRKDNPVYKLMVYAKTLEAETAATLAEARAEAQKMPS